MSGFSFRIRGSNFSAFGRFGDNYHSNYHSNYYSNYHSSYRSHNYSNGHNRFNLFAWFNIQPHHNRQEQEQEQQQQKQVDPKDNTQQAPAVSKMEPYGTKPEAYATGPRTRGNSLTRDKIALLDGPGNELNDRAAMRRIGEEFAAKGVDVRAALDQILAVGNQGKYVSSSAAANLILALDKVEASGKLAENKLTKADKAELARTFAAASKLRSQGDDTSNPAIEAAERLVASLKTENSSSVAATVAGAPPAPNKMAAK